jgi:hypothetical protein
VDKKKKEKELRAKTNDLTVRLVDELRIKQDIVLRENPSLLRTDKEFLALLETLPAYQELNAIAMILKAIEKRDAMNMLTLAKMGYAAVKRGQQPPQVLLEFVFELLLEACAAAFSTTDSKKRANEVAKSLYLTKLGIGLAMATIAYGQDASPVDSVEQLRWVQTADPTVDARAAVANHDSRLLGIYGYTWMIPGIPEEHRLEYKDKYGLRMIEGTSDSIQNEEHGRLISAATTYAKKYNAEILRNAK